MVKLTAPQKKNILYISSLIGLLVGTLLFYFLCVRVKPNDKILTTSSGVALFANENPAFNVQFGDKGNPDGQWVRFEAESSVSNPFISGKKKNIFTQLVDLFTPAKKVGIEMSLRGVDFSETTKSQEVEYDQEVAKVADILGTEEIATSTVLAEMGREIGKSEDDQIISKQTIVNQNVADGIDLEYQILTGLGLKEEIVINDLEAYRNSCDSGCKLPLNEFVFELRMDEGVDLKKGWYTIEGKSTEAYYFVDSKGRYLAHFLPNYAVDASGVKTYDVGLIVLEKENEDYEIKVTVSSNWLLDGNRTYPIRIDPSIVHDDTSDFSGGIFDRSESVTGPKVQLLSAKAPVVDANTVVLLHLDEASGSGAYLLDSSANGNNGTPTGTTYISNGKVGGARNFSGSNNTINVGSATSLDFGNNGPFTFSAWVKPTTLVDYAGFVSKDTAGRTSPYSYMTTFMANGRLEVYNGSAWADLCPAGTIANGNWYYVTFAYNGTNMYGYVNGVLCGSVAFAYTDNSAHEVTIGSWYAPTSIYDFNGIIDEVHISNIARTSTQIQSSYLEGRSNFSGIYTSSTLDFGSSISGMTMSWAPSGVATGNGETPYSTTGMAAQWNFNETSGTSAVSVGTCSTSCNGTLTNMTTTAQDAAAGTGWTANNKRWGGGAVMFDGTDDSVLVSDYADIKPASAVTVETWANVRKTGAQVILTKRYAASADPWNSYALDITATNNLEFCISNGTAGSQTCIASASVVELNAWTHVVGTYDGANMILYVNGVLVNSVAKTGSIGYSTVGLYLGQSGYSTTPLYFGGVLDSTRIYSRALASSEILSNYQSGNIEFQYRTSTDNSTWSNWTSYNDGALMFDGTDDYVVISDNDDLDLTPSVTLEAWVNLNNVTATYQTIIGKRDASITEANYVMRTQTDQLSFYYYANGSYQIYMTSNASLVPNTWYHIVATFDGSSVNIYKNGTLLSGSCINGTCNVSMVADNNNIGIGRAGENNSGYFSGIIDSVRIYSRVLGISEIAANYAMADGESPSNTANLIGEWKLNDLNGTTATNVGTCGIPCNGTLTNISNTTGRDAISSSGWTATTKRGSDSLLETFDNLYLYKTTDTGLVSYWPMNEASGTSVADAKSSYTGTASTTTIVDGKHSYGRNFNGSSSGMALASGSAADITGDITFEAWIKPLSFAAAQGIVTKSSQYALHITITTGYVAWADSSNWSFANFGYKDIGLKTGVWQHIAVTKTGGVVKIYLNGVQKVSQSFGSSITSTSNIMNIGCYSGASVCASSYFNGPIDEVRIFNSALSASAISSDYLQGIVNKSNNILQNSSSLKAEGTASTKLTNGPYANDPNTVGLWHLDERSGTSAYIKDSSVNARHATPTGTTYTNSGKIGGARSFNGSSDYIAGPDIAAPTNLTIEAWFKTTSTGTSAIASHGNTWSSTDIDWLLYLDASGYVIFRVYRFSAGVSVTTTTAYNDGNWHHVSGVISGTSASLYVDGVLKASQTVAGYTANTKNFQIGVRPGRALYFFPGSIDEVRFSNVARTANEIAESYKLGKDSYINQAITSIDLSTKNTLGINVASDRPGAYLSATWGESAFANYLVDANTAGLWHMEEVSGSGAYIQDVSGYVNNGTPTAVTYSSGGKLGGAGSFNGSSSYVDAGNTTSLQITSSITTSAWINLSALPGAGVYARIISKLTGAPYNGYELVIRASNDGTYPSAPYLQMGNAGTLVTVSSPFALTTNRWYYIVGVYDASASTCYMYVNGTLAGKNASCGASAIGASSANVNIGRWTGGGGNFLAGLVDEARIDNVARTADQIRQAYEVGLRTHNITVEFGAGLGSGNLITGSGDYSFSIDATRYGLAELGSGIYVGDKIIVKENYNGTEYIAQGTVSAVTSSTGAVTVSSWDSGGTFPTGGYTVNADVFKWQKEYIPIKNRTLSTQVDAANLLTFRLNDGTEGRNIWIDNLRSSSGDLSTSAGEVVSFASSARYVQYKGVFTSWDNWVTPSISQVQLDYQSSGPTMEQIMRHGKWFDSSGAKKEFWWIGTH